MTPVSGNPPTSPARMFPTPCATSSRLAGASRLYGSSLSVASRLSSVSRLATRAMVIATVHTALLESTDQSGNESAPNSSRGPPLVKGSVTSWSGLRASGEPVARSSSFTAVANSTTASGPGSALSFLSRVLSHSVSSPSDATEMNSTAGVRAASADRTTPKGTPSSPSLKADAVAVWPSAYGSCFMMRMIPIAASIPLITDVGKK